MFDSLNTLDHQLIIAYVGPGGGLAAIGTLLAIVVGLMAAVFGFLWYPLKRMLRGKQDTTESASEKLT